MRLCLVEDHAVAGLEPLTLTRPAYELRLGGMTLGDKIKNAFKCISERPSIGATLRPHLAAIQRERDPETIVNDATWLGSGALVVANARWVPPIDFEPPATDSTWIGLCDGEPACAFVGPELAAALEWGATDAWFDDLSEEATCRDVGGDWIRRPWDLVAQNPNHIARDFGAMNQVGASEKHLATLALVGPADQIFIHESARIDPYTVFDTTSGPITIEAGVWVQPFTRIEGPCHVGPGTQLFRASIRGGVTLGPNCRIGGEVEASIVHGHSNKYHEGFLGHSYVGEWVNLGAITSNSDLRNDYGAVSVPLQGDPVPTGQTKVGCFIGDHTRTGLGSMLNTGTALGVMCNVLPAGPLLPKHVPSFTSVLHGRVAPGFSLEQLMTTARTVMSRRGKVFTQLEEQLYVDLFEQTVLERERAFQRSHDHRGEIWLPKALSR
jgi:UDP-N-acetylglucosamine diphosphorylase / glucose-1-phosphate thymidylyltransferase / UDP-N-acetylgalactosamine diphosphorylase / glucosamine-1-phosphate N-acetyltransferase / galactosamine-1-phosphate N-acetyltransferase